MIWYEFGVCYIVIAIQFFALQYGVLKIQLKPFFLFINILMYLLEVSFAGSGIKELQKGRGVLLQMPIESLPVPTIDILGICPTVETFGLQTILIMLGVGNYLYRRSQHEQKLS